MSDVIIVENLGKWFHRYQAAKPVTLKEAVINLGKGMQPVDKFWALRHVSVSVAAGEMLGVIGHNGAGKSTFLQLVGGVGRIDEGSVTVKGKIGALLDLGAGFHGDLTGRENVYVTGSVAGLRQREIDQLFDTIVDFAELHTFIDNPVRTYSTGMQVRLAFAIAVHTHPDVLLVDEFLAVGDLSFQAKCLARIQSMKEEGCAIILISHDPNQVQTLCDHALWLRKGEVVACGSSEVVAGQYVVEMRNQTLQRTPTHPPQTTQSGTALKLSENRFGSLEAEITALHLCPQAEIEAGEALDIAIQYVAHQSIEAPIFGISISDEEGTIWFESDTESQENRISKINGQGHIKLCIDRLDFRGGNYFVDVGIYEQNWDYAYDYHWHVYPLLVTSREKGRSVLLPPHTWQVKDV